MLATPPQRPTAAGAVTEQTSRSAPGCHGRQISSQAMGETADAATSSSPSPTGASAAKAASPGKSPSCNAKTGAPATAGAASDCQLASAPPWMTTQPGSGAGTAPPPVPDEPAASAASASGAALIS